MATNLPRVTAKIFAENAAEKDIAQYGSVISGSAVFTSDISQIQQLPAFTTGWRAAVISDRNYPTLPEMNGLQKTFSQQIAYTLQKGMPEWDAGTTYYANTSFCQVNGVWYQSLTDNNIGNNPLTDETNWKKVNLGGGGGLEVGDIGIAALGIDESKGLRRYLNGSILTANTNTQGFINKLKSTAALYPSIICTETQWQAIAAASVGGQCGKFVINYNIDGTTVVSVRLPKIIMPIQGLTDLTKLGEIVSAGLPSHTHTRGSMNITGNIGQTGWEIGFNRASGAFSLGYNNVTALGRTQGSYAAQEINFNAANSWTGSTSAPDNLIYSASTTVQQEQIQYPYFIQIATGVEYEVNITNDIELNNPFFFGMSQYFDVAPNNLSWLKSDGRYKSKSVYPDFYDWIVEQAQNGIDGFKGVGYGYSTADNLLTYWITSTIPAVGQTVYGYSPIRAIGKIESLVADGFVFTDATSTQRTVTRNSAHDAPITDTNWINDYDFVINTTDETFRLPLLDGSENVLNFGASPTLITQNWVQGTQYTAPKNGHFTVYTTATGDGQYINYVIDNSFTFNSVSSATQTNVDTVPVRRGSILTLGTTFGGPKGAIYFYPNTGNGSLFFYVGETVQNANLIDAGRIGEQLATKTDMLQASKASMPSDRYIDLTLGVTQSTYIAPANGWFFCFSRANIATAYEWIYVGCGFTPSLTNYTYALSDDIARVAAGSGKIAPVRKGDQILIDYGGVSNIIFRFIYAEGN